MALTKCEINDNINGNLPQSLQNSKINNPKMLSRMVFVLFFLPPPINQCFLSCRHLVPLSRTLKMVLGQKDDVNSDRSVVRIIINI